MEQKIKENQKWEYDAIDRHGDIGMEWKRQRQRKGEKERK